MVIGLGELGLQAISLLLPRLEVYYQFVAEGPQPPSVARLGLVSRQGGAAEYQIVERAPAAFANTAEIQRLVLRPPSGGGSVSARLLSLIDAPSPTQPASLRAWLEDLIRPAITDVPDHTSSIIHLNLYLIASAGEQVFEDLEAIVRELAERRKPPITVNLLAHLSAPVVAGDSAGVQSASFVGRLPALAAGGNRIQRIYMLDHSKQNLAATESLGEEATAICNFLEQLILGSLGDRLVEMGLPDVAALAIATPYSTFGAAKLYVPIAEISSDLLTQFVAELLQREIGAARSGDADLAAALERSLAMRRLCEDVLNGLPVEPVAHSSWLRVRLQELAWWLRGEGGEPEALRERLLRGVPRLRVSRRRWRLRLRSLGRRATADGWWRALSEFEAELLGRMYQLAVAQASQRLGVEVEDERLASALLNAPARRDPIAGEVAQGSVQQRAARLSLWARGRRADLQPVVASLRAESEERIFGNQAIEARQLLPMLGAWLGHWLWAGRAGGGRLAELVAELRRASAVALAQSVAWAAPLAQSLVVARTQVAALREQLGAWADTVAARGDDDALRASRRHLADEQAALVAALHTRPYPGALLVRLAVLWLLPTFIALFAARTNLALPAAFAAQLPNLIVGYTAAIIGIYVLVLVAAALRRARAQRRIENLVFAHVAHAYERLLFAADVPPPPASLTAALAPAAPAAPPAQAAVAEEPTPGVIPAYLCAFERLLLAPALPDPRLPNSLFATLDGARGLIAAGYNPDSAQPRPESVLCRSVGDRLTRELLDQILRDHLATRQTKLAIDPFRLAHELGSPAAVNDFLRQTLKTQLGREYVATVRAADVLRLRNLLLLPEHRHVNVAQVIDDLQLRARPMVSMAQGASRQVLSRETRHYIAAMPEVTDELLRPQLGREQGLHVNAVRDPYGIGFATVVHGLSAEVLPLQPVARKAP